MLPSAAALPNLEPTLAPNPQTRTNRAVLLVEDEESLGELLVQLLTRVNIRVFRATDGAAALQQFAEHQQSIALAFVDCRLPDMDGGELCQQLRDRQPRLPLLLTSGRDQRALLATFSAGGPTVFLPKPYMPGDVVRHVNALLSASG